MLSFAYKRFDGVVPEPGALDDEDQSLLEKVEAGFETVGDLYNACKFRAAPSVPSGQAWVRPSPWPARPTVTHSRTRCWPGRPQLRSNCPADAQRQPWFQIKEDRQAAATTVYVILRVVDNLKTILAPVLPHTAQQLHEYLGYEGQLFGTQHVVEYQEETRSHEALTYDHSDGIGTWTPSALPAGQALRQPAPLFKKLDESVVEEEYARLEG